MVQRTRIRHAGPQHLAKSVRCNTEPPAKAGNLARAKVKAVVKNTAFSSLPQGVQAALALRWWATETEDGVMQKAKDGNPLSDQRWDAFLRLPKSQQAVGRKHMAALMALLELERNGASRNQAIATLQSQGVVHSRRAIFRRLKSVKGHPKNRLGAVACLAAQWRQPARPLPARGVGGF